MDVGGAVDLVSGLFDVGWSASKDIASAVPTHCQCTVHIWNKCSSYTLCNPRERPCVIPFPPIIPPSETGDAKFSKTPNTARGSVGVFTYDLLDNPTKKSTEKIAIMYNVPFDLNLKSNAYALGFFDISAECDRHLFQEMSKKTSPKFIKGKAKGLSLTHKSDSVTIRATMSDCSAPVIKVQVSDN